MVAGSRRSWLDSFWAGDRTVVLGGLKGLDVFGHTTHENSPLEERLFVSEKKRRSYSPDFREEVAKRPAPSVMNLKPHSYYEYFNRTYKS